MKRQILFLAAFFLAFNLQAQSSYKVIKVNGSIQYVRTGSKMALGDVFEESEDLSFESPASRAAVIHPEKGRFILSPESSSQLSGSKSNFLPAMSNISTRGGAINSMRDLQNQFSETIVVLYLALWHVNPYEYPMDENRFFYLQFEHNGEQINKKLLFDGNRLAFKREDILKVDDKSIDTKNLPNTSLYYYSDDGPLFISTFDLLFPDLELFKQEAEIILEELKAQEYNIMVNEISGYLYEFYGKPDKMDVSLFLDTAFGEFK